MIQEPRHSRLDPLSADDVIIRRPTPRDRTPMPTSTDFEDFCWRSRQHLLLDLAQTAARWTERTGETVTRGAVAGAASRARIRYEGHALESGDQLADVKLDDGTSWSLPFHTGYPVVGRYLGSGDGTVILGHSALVEDEKLIVSFQDLPRPAVWDLGRIVSIRWIGMLRSG